MTKIEDGLIALAASFRRLPLIARIVSVPLSMFIVTALLAFALYGPDLSPDARITRATDHEINDGPVASMVPSVYGAREGSATAELDQAGFYAYVTYKYTRGPEGVVVSQDPPAGTAWVGSTVNIALSQAYPAIPGVLGSTLREARAFITGTEFKVEVVERSSAAPAGTVLAQRPAEGVGRKPGSIVRLVVAIEPPGVFGNPWGYEFSGSTVIYRPPNDFCLYFYCISSFWSGNGYVVQCLDGEVSRSGGIQGACSYHGGVRRPVYAHG